MNCVAFYVSVVVTAQHHSFSSGTCLELNIEYEDSAVPVLNRYIPARKCKYDMPPAADKTYYLRFS